MGKIAQLTDYLTRENHFKNYLSIFRIFLCLLIFNKMVDLWGNISILLSNDGIYSHPDNLFDAFGISTSFVLNHSKAIILTIVCTLFLLLFGIGRKWIALLLYLEIYFLDFYISPILNGGDNLLQFALLYFVFTNAYDKFTISNQNKHSELSNFFSNLAVYSIMIHLCYVYFITGFHKTHAEVWFNGTAVYYILNLERFQGPFSYLVKDNGFITTLFTYATVLFELFFCVLIWQKNFRNILLITGVFLHLGIFVFMMIFDFEIFFISLYGFFFTNAEWDYFLSKVRKLEYWMRRKFFSPKLKPIIQSE